MTGATNLLDALPPDDAASAAQLLPLVYDDLRRLAAHRLAHEAPGQTLDPTALLVCTLSVSGAVFVILELDRPYEGIMRLSSAPLREALAQIGK